GGAARRASASRRARKPSSASSQPGRADADGNGEHGTAMARSLYEAIIDGVLGGGVYALMAVGLTLIFGVLDIINIAQGILVVLAAYLSYVLETHFHIDLFVGLLVTVPAMFLIGLAIQVLFMRPLRGRERVSLSLLARYAVPLIPQP